MNNNTLIKTVYAVLKQANVCHTDCNGDVVAALNPVCYGTGGGATAFTCADLGACSLTDLGTANYTDLSGLPTLKSYTLVAVTGGFNLVDELGTVVSTIPFPTGTGAFTCSDLSGCSLADLGTRNYNDLQNLPTITDTNTTYTIVANGTTGFSLVDDTNTAISTINFPTGSSSSFTCADLASCSLADLGTKNYSDLTGLPTIPTDVSNLTDTTDLLHVYNLVTTATGFTLNDENGVVSTITYPSGTTDTFVTITESATEYSFTPAGGGTAITIPKWTCSDLSTCDITDLTDTTGALTHNTYTIVATATGFTLNDQDGIVSTYTLPSGSTDTFVTIVENTTDYTFTPAGGGTSIVIPKFSCADLGTCDLTDLQSANYSDLTGAPTDISSFTDTTNLIKEYSLNFPDNIVVELIDDTNTVISSFRRNTVSIADGNCIDLNLTTTNQTPLSGGIDYNIQAELIVAPTQGGVTNALQCIPGQGAFVPASVIDICNITAATADTDGCYGIDPTEDTLAACVNGATVQLPISGIVPTWRWYEGGDNFRVFATYDPFTANYANPSAGVYNFNVPSCHQLETVEWIIGNGASGTINNMNTTNTTVINVTTPTGNTDALDTSQPNTFINSPTSGNNVFSSGDPNLVGTQTSRSFGGGTITLSTNNLVNHVTGKVSISNLTQNPA